MSTLAGNETKFSPQINRPIEFLPAPGETNLSAIERVCMPAERLIAPPRANRLSIQFITQWNHFAFRSSGVWTLDPGAVPLTTPLNARNTCIKLRGV